MLILLRAALRFVFITGVTLLIALAVLTGLLRLGLPYASTYKNEIQAWVSDYLGAPVEIGTMDLGWDGVRPHISLDDVALARGPQRGVKVSLEQIDLDFHLFKSLFTGSMHINDVTIIGANLSLEYFGNSEFRISSNPFNEDPAASTPADTSTLDVPSWLFNARRVGLLHSRVKLLDRERGIDYQIDNLNVRAENDADFHQLRIDLQLPEQLGKTLEIGVDLTGDSDALEQSTGRFYSNATDLQIQDWMNIWPDRLVSARGVSDLEIWGEWGKQRLQSLRGRVDGHHVEMVAGNNGKSSAEQQAVLAATGGASYPSFESDFTWRRQNKGWRLEIDKLNFDHAGRFNQIDGALITRQESDTENNLRITGRGELLDIGALSRLLATFERVPVLAPVARYASGAMMRGDLQNWEIDAVVGEGEPSLNVSAKLVDFAMNSYQRFPGIKNLSGTVELAENRGRINLDATDLVIQHRRVFPEPLSLARVEGLIDLDLTDDRSLLRTNGLRVSDDALLSIADIHLFREQGKLGYEVNAAYGLDDIATAKRYLPLGLMRPRLVQWLKAAPQSGELKDGHLTLRGYAGEQPWKSADGHFSAEYSLSNATLNFRPGWPALTDADGKLRFTGQSLTFTGQGGQIASTNLTGLTGRIENFRQPVLKLESTLDGTLQSLLDFANDGPLKNTLAPAFAQTRGSGVTTMKLATAIPLRPKRFRTPEELFSVRGRIALPGNRLRFDRYDLDLQAVSGEIDFTESGVSFDSVNAEFLDTPVSMFAETGSEGSGRRTDIRMTGLFHADRVLAHYGIPGAEFVEGPAQWRVQLQIPHPRADGTLRPVRLTAWSDLIGSAVNLPVPLTKGAGNARALSVATRFSRSSTQRWDIKYDTLMQARLHTMRGGALKSMSLALGKAELHEEPESGIRVDGDVNAMAFDGWIKTIDQIIESASKPGTPKKIQPVYADVRTGQLLVGNQLTGSARLRVNTDNNNINASLSSQHLRGNIRFPREHWQESKPVRTRISFVDQKFITALATSGAGPAGEPIDPTGLPRIEAHVAELRYDSFVFENIGLRTEPTASGLLITALGFANDSSQLVGEGHWSLKDPQGLNPALKGQQDTRLDLKFQSDNLGKAMASMGYSDAMADGRGAMSLNLSWSGPAYKLDVPSLDGKLSIRFKDGQLLRVEPGAAKLIGLFALQEIPRRLSLDFRDVVKDGLDFGEINGDITIAQGVATTHLLQLDGPIGVVDITGVSDLKTRTLNQKVQVLPRVSAALPILGLLSGGATAGIGALLATPVLKRLGIDFDRLGLTEYTLTGGWENPVIERINVPEPTDPSLTRD
ncbi:MAG: TIGR02099 family protein [Gammaproteobacteria bacterium]|nr:TIGR02099 family protein [Gammaproteobacteria bacterium]